MAKLKLVDKNGKASGDLNVSDFVFGAEPNNHVLYLATVRQQSNARKPIAKAKTRSEVRGGGAKPWKQKGTGRARAGSIRSPLWDGGGVIFGPTAKENYTKDMNKKERRLALRSALSLKAPEIVAVADFGVKDGKTKEFAAFISGIGFDAETTLIIADSEDKKFNLIKRAGANIPSVKVVDQNRINVVDLLKATKVVIQESAAKAIDKRLQEAVEVA